jgi:hypothetical protein
MGAGLPMPTIAPISNATTGAAIATPGAAMPAAADGGTGSGRQAFESLLARDGLSKPDAPATASAPTASAASFLQALGRDANSGRQELKPERASNNTMPIFNSLGTMSLAMPSMPMDWPLAPDGAAAPVTDTSPNPSTAASTATSSPAIGFVAAAISQLRDGSAASGQANVVGAQDSNAQADIAPTREANSRGNPEVSIQAEQTTGAGQSASAAPASETNSSQLNEATSVGAFSMAATEALLFTQDAQTKAAPQNSADAKTVSPASPSNGPTNSVIAPSPANSSSAVLQTGSAGNGPESSSTLPAALPSPAAPAANRTAEKGFLETLSRFEGVATVHSQAASNAPATANVLPPFASSPDATKTTEANPAAISNSRPAQNPAAQASDSGSGAAANHSDNSSNSGRNAQKNSNSDAAAEVKAAGLASTSGDQSSHAPADAPAQSAGAAAGTAAAPAGTNSALNAANSGSASAAIFTRPQPLPAPMPQSLGDIVKASDLYQRVGGAEIHISMDTDLLGSIDVRAVVHQSTLTATIGVERADVQTMLANDLPALQHSLAEQSLHINEISVMSGSIGARSDLSGNSQPQQHPAAQPRFTSGIGSIRDPFADFDSRETPLEALLWNSGEGRISIHV